MPVKYFDQHNNLPGRAELSNRYPRRLYIPALEDFLIYQQPVLGSGGFTATPTRNVPKYDLVELINSWISTGSVATGNVYTVADTTARDAIDTPLIGDIAVMTDAGSGNQGVSFYSSTGWTNPIEEGGGGSSNTVVLADHSALKAYTGSATLAVVQDADMGGLFYITSTGVGTRNGGTVYRNTANTLHFHRIFDGVHYRPEWWVIGEYSPDADINNVIANGGDQIAAATITAAQGGVILLKPDTTYLIDRAIPIYANQRFIGTGNSVIKRDDPVVANLTANWAASGSSITVDDASGFRVGQRIVVIDTSATNGGFGYGEGWYGATTANRTVITGISGNIITFNGTPNTAITAANGDVYTCHNIFFPEDADMGDIYFEGVTFDGNGTNNPIKDWRLNNTYFDTTNSDAYPIITGCRFVDLPSENFVIGGGVFDSCTFDDLTGSLVHVSNGSAINKRPLIISNCWGSGFNSGTDAVMQHSEGMITLSAGPINVTLVNCSFDTGSEGILGGVGADTPNLTIDNCTFENFANISLSSVSSASTGPVPNTKISNNRFINCGDLLFNNSDTPTAKSFMNVSFTDNLVINGRVKGQGLVRSRFSDNRFIYDDVNYTFAGFDSAIVTSFPAYIYLADCDQLDFTNNLIKGPRTFDANVANGIIYDYTVKAASDGRFRNSAAATATDFLFAQNMRISGNKILWFKSGFTFRTAISIFDDEMVGWSVDNNIIVLTDSEQTNTIGIEALPGMQVHDNIIYVNTDANTSTYGIAVIGLADNNSFHQNLRGPIVRNNTVYGHLSTAKSIQVGGNTANDLAGYNAVVFGNVTNTAIAGFADNLTTNSLVSNNFLVNSTTLAHLTAPADPVTADWGEDTAFY